MKIKVKNYLETLDNIELNQDLVDIVANGIAKILCEDGIFNNDFHSSGFNPVIFGTNLKVCIEKDKMVIEIYAGSDWIKFVL